MDNFDPLEETLAMAALEALVPEGYKLEFFYTTDTPHSWSSGATINTLDQKGQWSSIRSFSRARELAEENVRGKFGEENYVTTTYGVRIVKAYS